MFLNLHIAYASLKAHKLRTVLAMLGVFLGALAFTGVQTVSEIMVEKAEREAQKMGPGLFAIMAGQVRFHRRGGISFREQNTNFKPADIRSLIESVPGVIEGTPVINMSLPVRAKGTTITALITACWPEYQRIRHFYPAQGRFFTKAEEAGKEKLVVLGVKIAERLFGSAEQALGAQVFVYRAGFRVIGIMEAKGRDLAGVDQDEQVFMPLGTYMRRASNVNWVNGGYLRLEPGVDIEMIKSSCREIIRKRHHLGPGEKDDFSMLEPKEAIAMQRQALDLMQTLGLISSTISFSVGGMGILSIMVLMVRARRVEIGIRRAVGGRRSDIVRQFLYESAMLAVCGSACGILLCLLLILVFTSFTAYPLVINPIVFGGTLAGAAIIGVFAGSYPAWQASRIVILDVLKS